MIMKQQQQQKQQHKQKQDHQNQQQPQQQQKPQQKPQHKQKQDQKPQQQNQHRLKSSLRCCISCILPCGAFDVIRIVHSNGHVQELACTVRAADVMESHPKHILKQPSFDHHQGPTVIVVPPEAHLQRGKIYFLIPVPVPPAQKKTATSASSSSKRRQQRRSGEMSGSGGNKAASRRANVVMSSDQYLSEIMSENKDMGGSRERRRGRVGVWRPHLECITETP